MLHLIEEHRNDLVIPHSLDVAGGPSCHKFGIDFRHFLGNQPILPLALRILLIAKDDGAQLEQSATVRAHGLDVALVAAGGDLEAQLARTVDEHRRGRADQGRADKAGDEGPGLGSPEAHRVGFRRRTAAIAEIDVVAPTYQCLPGSHPDRDIVVARGGAVEREGTDSGVVDARGGAEERIDAAAGVIEAIGGVVERAGAGGGVVEAHGVADEREGASGSVVAAQGGVEEREGAGGSVVAARGVAEERLEAAGGVVAAHEVVEEREGASGSVVVAQGVVLERAGAGGGVVVAEEVVLKRAEAVGGVKS